MPIPTPVDVFQFHKVRLKVACRTLSLTGLMFQFHKVRLKVLVGLGILYRLARFNSIRYD